MTAHMALRVAVVIVLILFAIRAAMAHMNYPSACCGNNDCRPVPCHDLVEDNTGWLYLPTMNHFEPAQVLPSQDRFCHVCLGMVDKRSLCAFIQQGV